MTNESQQPYSAREVKHFVDEIKELFAKHADEDEKNLGRINDTLIQLTSEVKKTNGDVQRLKIWKAYTMGGLTIISMVVLPILAWALWTIIEIKNHAINVTEPIVETIVN